MTGEVCWQYLVKQRKAKEEASPSVQELLRPIVAQITQSVARQFVAEYEWLGHAGASRYCYGLIFGEHLAAVVCYARPTSSCAFAALVGVVSNDVLQLCRGASTHWAPRNSASMLISRSMKLLEAWKQPRLVVAYADPSAGEIGTVYQATNALYLGYTNSRGPGEYLIGGRRYHPRSVHRRFGSAKHEVLSRVDPSYSRFQRTKKHRYVYALGSERERRDMIERLSPLVKPYPKREQNAVPAI